MKAWEEFKKIQLFFEMLFGAVTQHKFHIKLG